MNEAALGALFVYFFLAIIGFLIAALILRGIFSINKIVELLSSIDARLRANGSTAPVKSMPSGTWESFITTEADAIAYSEKILALNTAQFQVGLGMGITEIYAGDEIETYQGERWTVVGFKRKGLQVKNESGRMNILLPLNPDSAHTEWKFNVRKRTMSLTGTGQP